MRSSRGGRGPHRLATPAAVLVLSTIVALSTVAAPTVDATPASDAVSPVVVREIERHGSTIAIVTVDAGATVALAALRDDPPAGITVLRTYSRLPSVVVEIDGLAALGDLARRPGLIEIAPDATLHPATDQSATVVNRPDPGDLGDGMAGGEGWTVAVVDTGIQPESAFARVIRRETCTWTPPSQEPVEEPVQEPDEAEGSDKKKGKDKDKEAQPVEAEPPDCRAAEAGDVAADDLHGTVVASIVADIAPGATIASFDVFHEGGAASSDVLAALDRVLELGSVSTGDDQPELPIAAVNLSLSWGGRFESDCSGDPRFAGLAFATAFTNLRAAGILPVVSAGNDPFRRVAAFLPGPVAAAAPPAALSTETPVYRHGVDFPSCVPGAVVVSGVYDASAPVASWDRCTDVAVVAGDLVCWAQGGALVDLVAPAAWIEFAGKAWSGTSMAAPHVAAAAATLRSSSPGADASADQVEEAMTASGPPVDDRRDVPHRSYPLLDISAAVDVLAMQTAEATSSEP